MDQLTELGFYALAGHSDRPGDLLHEVRRGEELGLGAVFISERFNLKDASTLCGAAAASSRSMGIATAATNHNTRHPLVTATFAATMHRLTDGRFALGLGRGFDGLFRSIGLQPITNAQLQDAAAVLRRLWAGETIIDHSGPLGTFPRLHQDSAFRERIPIMLVAIGERTLQLAGACMDGVVLHTFLGDEALARSVDAVRLGAERAGRDPSSVRVWSVLATVGDHVDEDSRRMKTVGRMASYLRGYGRLLVRANGWDPAVLDRFLSDPFVRGFQGAFDARATRADLDYLATLIPDAWIASAAVGTPEQCTATIRNQFDLGADSVILHGATPEELSPVLDTYRRNRPPQAVGLPANPGWAR
ncbi:MAG: TIGR03857 family LLM class F420-dependent oxidoreductase [Acidimicrobiales bacterium]